MEVYSGRTLQLIVLSFILMVLQSAIGCSREKSMEGDVGSRGPMPDQILTGFEITETSTGRKEWKMEADTAYVFESKDLIETRAMVITFFDENGDVKSILHAERGRINRKTEDMDAIGHVVLTSKEGTILKTQSLSWNSQTRQIVTQDSVKIIRENDELSGWGFSGDPDLGTFKIERGMKASIRQKGSNGGDSDERNP